jgi:Fe-S oxidoreductase
MQKCVYCPKLSRAACPVSNEEANETVTPWGKVSMAYHASRGDVPVNQDFAESAWACSGCFACRERCEHRNEVAGILYEARAEYLAAGVAPPAAKAVADAFPEHAEALARGVDGIDPEAKKAARIVLLLGCSYVRHHPEEAEAIWRVTQHVVDGEVRAARRCCGLPLLHAGDRDGMKRAAQQLCDEVADADLVIAADPGCARALTVDYESRAPAPPRVVPLVDVVYARLDRLPAMAIDSEAPRYHDPCQLGRGLGRYDEPRAILARIHGKVPREFQRRRQDGECSGAGGLLPLTRPETSRAMADARLVEHRDKGGGPLVTACGESLRRFRSRGEEAVDLWSLVAQALEADGGDDG